MTDASTHTGPGGTSRTATAPPERAEDAARVAAALRDPRYEIVPVKGVEQHLEGLDRQLAVTVVCLPAKGLEPTLELAERLARGGRRVVPHLPARLVTGREHLQRVLARLDAAGIREAFVIGGDHRHALGPYPSAVELLRAMAGLEHGITTVGVAAYPEPHPIIADDALLAALEAKRPFAAYMVTQMCFDPDVVVRWLHGMRERGIGLPVRLGVVAPVEMARLLRIAMKIGVRDAGRFLGRHTRQMGRLLYRYSPDAFLLALAPHLACERCRIAGLHVYTFNQVAEAEAWRRERLAGGTDGPQWAPDARAGASPAPSDEAR